MRCEGEMSSVCVCAVVCMVGSSSSSDSVQRVTCHGTTSGLLNAFPCLHWFAACVAQVSSMHAYIYTTTMSLDDIILRTVHGAHHLVNSVL